MINGVIKVDDQPISSGFYDEGHWLTDYVTPSEPDIQTLYAEISRGLSSRQERAVAAWDWVAKQVSYRAFIKAQIQVEGHVSQQPDFWQTPSMCARTHVGNCANKAFLLASLLRNDFAPNEVYCVLGNLYNGHASGHAWVQVNMNGVDYIMESTRDDVPLIPAANAARYEPVHFMNDQTVLAVPGRTVMTPFEACYSNWLRDYLQWSYIEGGKI